MQPTGIVLDEYQHVHPPQQHRVNVQEVGRDHDPRLRSEELPPARPGAPQRRIDPAIMHDLPDSGDGVHHALLGIASLHYLMLTA